MSKYSKYFVLEGDMRKQGMQPIKEDLIYFFTDGKKHRLTLLTQKEYEGLCDWMSSKITTHIGSDRSNVMRRKLIACMSKMGYSMPSNSKTFKTMADMPRIYAWVIKYGYLKKPLNNYTVLELPKLVSQVEMIYKKHLNS